MSTRWSRETKLGEGARYTTRNFAKLTVYLDDLYSRIASGGQLSRGSRLRRSTKQMSRDALPARVHITLPASCSHRRLRVPIGVFLHHSDDESDRGWVGAVPVTGPLRTLVDCAAASLSPDLLEQAVRDAMSRGLVTTVELAGRGIDMLRYGAA